MAARYTVEQLQERQEKLRRLADKQRKMLAQVNRQVERERRIQEMQRWATLGRCVQELLGVETPDEFKEWTVLRGIDVGLTIQIVRDDDQGENR